MSPPWIEADPNPVPSGPGRGRATIRWDTGDRRPGVVTVSQDDGVATVFARGVTGRAVADWIQDGSRYRFELWSKDDGRRLGEVAVERASFDWDAAWDSGVPAEGPPPRRGRAAHDVGAHPGADGRAVERALSAIATALGRAVDPDAMALVEAARKTLPDGPTRAQAVFLAALVEDLRPALVVAADAGRAIPALLGPGREGPHVISLSPDRGAIRKARRLVRRLLPASEPRIAFVAVTPDGRSGSRGALAAVGDGLAALGDAAVDLVVVSCRIGRSGEGLGALRAIATVARPGTVAVFADAGPRPTRKALVSWERRLGGDVVLLRLPVGKCGVVAAVFWTGGGHGAGMPPVPPRDAVGDGQVRLSRVAAGEAAPLRTPRLPEPDRAPTYLDHFDATTLFYDVFRSADGRRVVALGPPLPPAAAERPGLEVRADLDGSPLAYRQVPAAAASGSHLPARLEIEVPAGTDRLSIRCGSGAWLAPIQPSLAGRFAGSVALVTVSRDNDLAWIADWARYHAATCGVDAVVLYDNGSTRYGIAEIEEALAGVPGIREALVIAQPVRFGPWRRDIAGDPRGFPDMFLQSAMLRHALDRILPRAEAMLNLDVDELLALREGEELRRWMARPEPVIEVPRFEVRRPAGHDPARPARHRDAWLQPTPRTPQPPKWVLRPADVPATACLGIHAVTDAPCHACLPGEAFVAHVREITHRVNEPARMGSPCPDAALVENQTLRRRLERVFGPVDHPDAPAPDAARPGAGE